MTTDKHNKRPNVPPLRFPEFTNEWDRSKLGFLTTKVGSGLTPRGGNSVYTEKGHCFVRSQNVGMGVLLLDEIAHIDDKTHQKQIATEILENDVLLNITGASIGRTAVATNVIAGGNVNQHVCIIRTNDLLNQNYLCNYIQTKKIQNYIYSLQTGGSREGLNFEQVRSFPICYPSKVEQIKISHLISLLDRRIEVQIGLIEDLQKLKAALVERLFCNKLGWKRYKYRDLLSPISERNSGNQFSNVLSASQELGMVSRTDLDIDIKFDRSAVTTYKIVRDGDYVLHLRSFQGGLAFSSMTGICSPAYTILRPVKELEYGFFQEYFMSKSFINSLRLVTYGIRDGRSINVDEFLDMPVEIPDSATQCRIISILSIMNRRLRLAIKQNENFIKQKQYLLQQMFI